MYVHTQIHRYKYACIYTYIHILYNDIYIHTYIHIYNDIYIHTYIQSPSIPLSWCPIKDWHAHLRSLAPSLSTYPQPSQWYLRTPCSMYTYTYYMYVLYDLYVCMIYEQNVMYVCMHVS